ncbi:two-component response regulator ARR14-like [Sesamum indicum]|uniref:Two-component response regulator ARR14-like n=1 Tax=Sesamum indicum TaxID=4182 RepID=A0A6I9T6J0_SESIN|nr:two-component response regulator ARR14-like [Sesamum indicum]
MVWEFGNNVNVWGDVRSSSAPPVASYHHAMMHEIHVLLVDHESDGLVNTVKLLELCQYRVTFVELASAAISMLLSGKTRFDVVMANINSPDLHGFKLLQHAVSLGLPVVLMSADDNTFMAMRALENGAFLYIKKPATMEMLRCLWQHVLREKTRMIRERDILVGANHGQGSRGLDVKGVAINHRTVENPNDIIEGMVGMRNKGKSKKKYRGIRIGVDEDEEYESENHMMMGGDNNVKRKMCTEWTLELHEKFMDAVEELGEGRCFPKEILEIMNVPGLTRMQVASHLQKCRNDNWRSPEERKAFQAAHNGSSSSVGPQPKPRRFGSKPQLGRTVPNQVQQETRGAQPSPETLSEAGMSQGVGVVPVMANNTNQQQYGTPVPDPNVDSLIQNYPGMQQGSGMNNPNPDPETYHTNPVYQEQKCGGGASADRKRSNWSSETSNFESDDSESRGHHDE